MDKKLTKTLFLLVTAGCFASATLAGPVDEAVDQILTQYSVIHDSLSKDTVQGVDSAAQKIRTIASKTSVSDPEVSALIADLEAASSKIQGQDLTAARNTFFELSKPLLVYLNKHYSGSNTYFRYFCGMAKKGWVQTKKDIRNPYYGSSMLTCGELIG